MLPIVPPRSFLLGLVVAVSYLGASYNLPAAFAQENVADESVLRSYLTANGLLNRGLFELAIPEYQTFLKDHAGHEKSPLARYGLAVCYFRLNKLDDCVSELGQLRAIKAFAFAAEVRTMLGQCELTRKNYPAAADLLSEVVRDFGSHELADDAAALRVEALYQSGKHAEMTAAAGEFAQRWGDSPMLERVLFFDALAALAANDAQHAAERLATLGQRFPDGSLAPQSTLLLGQCLQRLDRLDDAAGAFKRLADDPKSPFASEALLGLGTISLAKGQFDVASAAFDRIVSEYPQSAAAQTACFYIGRCAFERRDYSAALGIFDDAAKTGPADLRDDAVYWAAKCRLRENDPKDAAQRLRTAIAQFPKSDVLAEMTYDLAVALSRSDDAANALATLDAFRTQFPNSPLLPDALSLQAATEHQRGNYDASAALCRAFLSAYEQHGGANRVVFLLAENEFLANHHEAAVTGLRQFLERFPSDEQVAKARYRLGLALASLDKWDEAEPLLAAAAKSPDASKSFRSALLVLGDLRFQKGDFGEAERLLALFVAEAADAPDVDGAWLKLGLARQRQNKSDAAMDAFEQVIARFPNSPHRLQARFERAQLLAARNDDQARSEFEAVLAADPKGRFAPYALRHLAQLALRTNKTDDAANYLDALVAINPSDTSVASSAISQRASLLLASGDFAEAERGLRQVLADAPPDQAAPIRAQLVVALARQDRHEHALREIAALESAGLDKLDLAMRTSLLYEKAWCLRASTKRDDAAAAYRAVIELNGDDRLTSAATIELADLEADAKHYENAIALLMKLRAGEGFNRLAPESWGAALYRLGVCAFESQQLDLAENALQALLQESPDSKLAASAAYFAGDVAIRRNQHDKAITYLERAVATAKDDALASASLLKLGESLVTLQRWPAAEATFAKFLERFGSDERWYQARFGIGWSRENQQRYPEAIESYRDVTARHQGETAARAQFQIGECLFAQKKHEDAAREFLKVEILYAYPQWSAAALFEAGRCFELLSKSEDARKQFSAVTEKYSDTKWAAQARERITALKPANLPGR